MVGRLVVQLCEHFVWFPVPGDTLLYSLSTYSISTVTTFKIPFLRVCGSVLVRSTTPTNTYRFHSMVYRICSPLDRFFYPLPMGDRSFGIHSSNVIQPFQPHSPWGHSWLNFATWKSWFQLWTRKGLLHFLLSFAGLWASGTERFGNIWNNNSKHTQDNRLRSTYFFSTIICSPLYHYMFLMRPCFQRFLLYNGQPQRIPLVIAPIPSTKWRSPKERLQQLSTKSPQFDCP
jgi:hypothetical protein